MIPFLFFISFSLHIAALIAIFQLFKQVQTLKKDDPQDIMDVLETYLQEIKEENRMLQEEITTNMPKEPEIPNELSSSLATDDTNQTTKDNNEEIENILLDDNVQDSYEASLQAKVLQLYDQGFSEEHIARELNCGKTEASFIIKIHTKTSNKA